MERKTGQLSFLNSLTDVMDELLNKENENHLDTDWTLENKNNKRTQTEEDRLDPLPSISPYFTSTYNKANKSG